MTIGDDDVIVEVSNSYWVGYSIARLIRDILLYESNGQKSIRRVAFVCVEWAMRVRVATNEFRFMESLHVHAKPNVKSVVHAKLLEIDGDTYDRNHNEEKRWCHYHRGVGLRGLPPMLMGVRHKITSEVYINIYAIFSI